MAEEEEKKTAGKLLFLESDRVNYDLFTFFSDIMANRHIEEQARNDYKRKINDLYQKDRFKLDECMHNFNNGTIDYNELEFLLTVCSAEAARDTTVAMFDFLIEEAKKERYGK